MLTTRFVSAEKCFDFFLRQFQNKIQKKIAYCPKKLQADPFVSTLHFRTHVHEEKLTQHGEKSALTARSSGKYFPPALLVYIGRNWEGKEIKKSRLNQRNIIS